MSEVRSAVRTLELFEVYASTHEPLPLFELSNRLNIPMASCHRLLRTLVQRGYIYALSERGRLYYPTRRLLDQATAISEHDPVIRHAGQFIEDLRNRTGETAILARRQDMRCMHLVVSESPSNVRYSAHPGEFRALHVSAMGKALLSRLDIDERRKVLELAGMPKLARRSITSITTLNREIEASTERGWYENDEESMEGVYAIAMPVKMLGGWYAISVVCPAQRKVNRAKYLVALRRTRKAIEKDTR